MRRNHQHAPRHRHRHLIPMRRKPIPKKRSAKDKPQSQQHQADHPPPPMHTKSFVQSNRAQCGNPHRQRPMRRLFSRNQVSKHHRQRDQHRRKHAVQHAKRRGPNTKIVGRQKRTTTHSTHRLRQNQNSESREFMLSIFYYRLSVLSPRDRISSQSGEIRGKT